MIWVINSIISMYICIYVNARTQIFKALQIFIALPLVLKKRKDSNLLFKR